MKWIFLLMVLPSISLFGQQKDSVFCLKKNEVIILANKIQDIQDSLKYKSNVVIAQNGLITSLEKRVDLFEEQLKNKEETITLIEKQNIILKDQVELLRPKWYNDNRLWFVAGILTTSLIVVGSK